MLYNRTQIQGNSMPLLMGFTKPTKIECDETPCISYYDQISQIIPIECGRRVGTRSLKASSTGPAGRVDRKNEIDDQKYVQ